MSQYLLSIVQPDGPPPPPATLGKVMRDVDALVQQLRQAGALVFTGGLTPAQAATVVRVRDGDLVATDGPFAELKEHVGGFMIVDVRDRDAAIDWAGRFARALGLPIEVRAFQQRPS